MTAAPLVVEELTVWIDPDDPVFEGHYPGFPILPGLFLVEHVHQAVLALPAANGMRAVALERVRFRRPVYPGDTVTVAISLATVDSELVGAAELTVRSERVATMRLRYAKEAT